MLITLNITFCIFSMPMVILQIIYYSFYQFLANTSYYVVTTGSSAGDMIVTSYTRVTSPPTDDINKHFSKVRFIA